MSEDKITGHTIRLDDTRLVFLGQHPDEPDLFYMGFRNDEGNDTKIKFSREALDALVTLHHTPFKGRRTNYPHKMTWELVTTKSDKK